MSVTTSNPRQPKPSGIARFIPMLQWTPQYQRSWLRPDLIAGLTVAALVVPKSLGYAGIAGVPIQQGLYAAAAGAILYAFFGTCRQIATGPSSALATVAGGAVVTAAVVGDEAVALVASITFVTGLLFLLLAIFKMGWISQFLSKAVITGFLFGAAIEVVVGELRKLTGTSVEGANAVQKFWNWLSSLPQTDPLTLAVGLLSLLLIITLRFKARKVPGALVLVVLGIAVTAFFDLGDMGLALVGDVPRGLPSLVLPNLQFILDNIQVIGLASIGLLLIGFSQSAGDAREFAARHNYRIDIDQESVAQGLANVGSGLVQGIPVSTSLSASSLNDSAGAKTPVASLTTGALVILTLLFLAPVFSYLPTAVLAAVIIDAVIFGMINIKEMRRLWHIKRSDFWIAVAAIFGVLWAGVLAGVVVGIALSVVWLVYLAADPNIPVLGRKPGTQVFRSIDDFPDSETYPGLLVVRFDSSLFFANADSLGDRLRELAQDAEQRLDMVVIDFGGINFIDSQGSEKVEEILEAATVYGADLRLTRVKAPVLGVLERDGVIEELGADHIYGNVSEAVADRIPATAVE